jgi:hypothetical protein
MIKILLQNLKLLMMSLNTLYKRLFNREKIHQPESPPLRASILIGIDKQQQYFFDIKWDQEDIDKTSSDLANIVLGITYGLFVSHIKNLLVQHESETNSCDTLILDKTIQLISERSEALNRLLDENDNIPIIKPSEVLRPAQDVSKTN